VAPVTAVVDKLIVEPVHTGELLLATGVAGIGFTTTVPVPAALVQPPTVTVTLYVPPMATVADGRVGVLVVLVNDDGPLQAYVAPVTVGVLKEMVCPSQSGVLLVTVGVAGVVLITTAVVAVALVQPFTVAVTLYVPAIAAVAVGRVGFCVAFVNAEGPVQAYVAPVIADAVKLIVAPVQTGVLLPAVGAAGMAFTTTAVVAVALVQPFTVTVKLYVPDIATVDIDLVGSSNADVNVEGPVQA